MLQYFLIFVADKIVSFVLHCGCCCPGKIYLVDLAGSEKLDKTGADSTRIRESQTISKSLTNLGDVVHALRCKQIHVPYRTSKLTHLLQEALSEYMHYCSLYVF